MLCYSKKKHSICHEWETAVFNSLSCCMSFMGSRVCAPSMAGVEKETKISHEVSQNFHPEMTDGISLLFH